MSGSGGRKRPSLAAAVLTHCSTCAHSVVTDAPELADHRPPRRCQIQLTFYSNPSSSVHLIDRSTSELERSTLSGWKLFVRTDKSRGTVRVLLMRHLRSVAC